MKKLLLITLLTCAISTFTACGNEKSQTTSKPEIVEENTSEKETEEIPETDAIQEDISSESKDETTEDNLGEDTEIAELSQILSLKQTYSTKYEWQDTLWLLYSEYSNVTMWEGAEQYPKLDRALSEAAGMQTRSMEDEADNILSFITDMGMLDGDLADFETQVSTSNAQVRRADSVVLSYVTDSYADYGFIEDFRSVW